MRKLAGTALFIAVLSVLLEIIGGIGTRLAWFHFRTGLKSFVIAGQAGLYIAIAAAVLTVIFAARKAARREIAVLIAAAVIAAIAYYPVYTFKNKAAAVPPIHDISTDTADPPAFVKITPQMRGEESNPLEYGGPEVAEQQVRAYPDVKPLFLHQSSSAAFTRLLDAAKELGWQIVDFDPNQGRIEATATTPFFGFKDDIVVRIRDVPLADESKVDVRSVSRVGRSDVGANAARIRRYFALIKGE